VTDLHIGAGSLVEDGLAGERIAQHARPGDAWAKVNANRAAGEVTAQGGKLAARCFDGGRGRGLDDASLEAQRPSALESHGAALARREPARVELRHGVEALGAKHGMLGGGEYAAGERQSYPVEPLQHQPCTAVLEAAGVQHAVGRALRTRPDLHPHAIPADAEAVHVFPVAASHVDGDVVRKQR